MNKVIIEPYTSSYKSEVANLILNIQNNEFDIPITLAQQPDLGDIPGYYQLGKGNFWVAKVNDKVVGTISLLDIGNGKGALRKMFVDKDHRGKDWGVGQQLLETLFTWSREKQIKEIILGTTAKFVAAHRFYEKNGFVEIDAAELPKGFPRMEVDVKFYSYAV